MDNFLKWLYKHETYDPGTLVTAGMFERMYLGYKLEYLIETNPDGTHKIEYNDFEQLCEEIKKRVEDL
jgi:hypothetical protein